MSGTTVKTATEETPKEKTGKAATRKKVAKTTARKPRAGTTGVKKKTAAKKAVRKKPAARKPASGKTSKKTATGKNTSAARQPHEAVPEQTRPAAAGSAPEDSRSLSWMSAQAASALKAVKAHQAEKGQAVLARTRKLEAEKHLDDDTLIKIAAEMPVDDEALVEFSTEQTVEPPPEQPDPDLSAVAPVMDESSAIKEPSADQCSAPEPATDPGDDEAEAAAASTGQTEPALPVIPPPPAKRPAFQPALAAGLLFAAIMLGYYFWPEGDDSRAVVATQESPAIEAPAVATTPDEPQGTTAAQPAEPGQEAIVDDAWTPSSAPRTQVPPQQLQTAPVATSVEPEPAPVTPAPVATAPAPQPAPMEPAPLATAPAPQPAPVLPAPRATAPAPQPAPVEPAPLATAPAPQPAKPAVPAQPDRRAPAQGYYPQQRRQAYPQYYYR